MNRDPHLFNIFSKESRFKGRRERGDRKTNPESMGKTTTVKLEVYEGDKIVREEMIVIFR